MQKPTFNRSGFTLIEILMASGMLVVLTTFALVMISQAGNRARHLRVMMYALTDTQRLHPGVKSPPLPYAGRIPLKCNPRPTSDYGFRRIHLNCEGPRKKVRATRTYLRPTTRWGLP